MKPKSILAYRTTRGLKFILEWYENRSDVVSEKSRKVKNELKVKSDDVIKPYLRVFKLH